MTSYSGVRRQGDTKERQTKPEQPKTRHSSSGKSKPQTRERASSRALELVVLAVKGNKKSRVGGVTFVRSLTYEDFRTLFEGGRLILSNSELSGMHPNDVAVMFVDELVRRGYLKETEYGTFQPSSKLMTLVS